MIPRTVPRIIKTLLYPTNECQHTAEDIEVGVRDGTGKALQPAAVPLAASAARTPSAAAAHAFASGGRRLQSAPTAAPGAGSPQVSLQSVTALTRKSRECGGLSWDLELDAGQNEFSINTYRTGQVNILTSCFAGHAFGLLCAALLSRLPCC